VKRDFDRIAGGLGERWESEKASFKPFPAAHVIHPYLDAVLRLRAEHGIDPQEVERVACPVAAYIVGIVCEPVAEKRRPRSDSHGRVSLQYSLAEALVRGRLGKDAYQPAFLADPGILRIADRVEYRVDPDFPGPERFKGAVEITLRDGRSFATVEENNRGSAANPMPAAEIIAKFEENAAERLDPAARRRLVDAVLTLEAAPDVGTIVDLTLAGAGAC
jgi:2-methylcitrate dehydratase PrpD